MTGPRNTPRKSMQSARLASTPGLGKGGSRKHTTAQRPSSAMQADSASSDEDEDDSNADGETDEDNDDENDSDDDDDDFEEVEADEGDVAALSRSYPFEFGNDESAAGTDDDMDMSTSQLMAADSEFVKSMQMADYHASHDSDAEDYTALDQLSDDDDDDEAEMQDADMESTVLREAEKDLIAEFEQSEHQSALYAPHLTSTHGRKVSFAEPHNDELLGLPSGVNMNADPFQGAAFMDDTWGSLWETAELGIWRKPLQEGDVNEQARNPRQKRVRFQESTALARVSSNEDSTSSSEDDDAEQFPDIFVEQNDPKIRHLLDESEPEWNGLGGNGSDLESVYDFEDDADRFAFELDEESASSEADVSSESDDDGDDTEDETVEEQHAKMQQFRKAMRQVATASTPSTPRLDRPTTASFQESARTPAGRRTISPKMGRGPRQGTFICDPTKAILTTDKSTRKTILYPPAQPSAQHKAFWDRARSAVQATNGSPRGSIAIPATQRDDSPERPFTAKATLGSMFDGRIDIFDEATSLPPTTQTTSPFPSFSPSVMTSFTAADDGSDMDAEYPAAFNTLLNMDEFDDSSSDTDMNAPGPRTGEPAFLAHGVVGSFRLNQHRARLESSLPSNPAKRASTAEHNALQSGRRAAGNAPITPARKRRSNSQDLFRTGSGVKKNTALAFSSPSMARRRHSRGQSLSGRLDQTLTPEMWKRI